MLKPIAVALLATSLLGGPALARATLSVEFVHPERYADREFRSSARRASAVKELDRHIRRLAERHLRDGQMLEINVLDVRLAGYDASLLSPGNSYRVLTDATPPRIKLHYRLSDRRRVLTEGTETLTDINYLWDPAARFSHGRFDHEKRLLADWFRSRLVNLEPRRR